MVQEATTPASRRALLAAGLGGIVAYVAHAIGRPLPVRAGVDGDVVLGSDANTAASTTGVTNSSSFQWAFVGRGSSSCGVGVRGEGGSVGVSGFSDSGVAMEAFANNGPAVNATAQGSNQAAVRARSLGFSAGVLGYSGPGGAQPFATAKVGVEGVSEIDAASRGVYGHSTLGRGVEAKATSGVGLYTSATTGTAMLGFADTNGTALRTTRGHVRFSTAGLATIAAGTNSVLVTPGFDISLAASKILAVLQGNPGAAVWVRHVERDDPNNRFRIVLSGNVAVNTPVAWFVIS